MADYKSSSPYSKTKMVGDYLDLMTQRSVAYDRSDETYIVESK